MFLMRPLIESRYKVISMFTKLFSLTVLLLLNRVAFASPTTYLPVGSDGHLERQIDHLFVLTRGTPMRKPYAIKEIELALQEIKQSTPLLYQSITEQLDRYQGNSRISRVSLTTRASFDKDSLIANQRGLNSDEYLQTLVEAVWRPNENSLVQAGLDYRVSSGELVPHNTFVAYSVGNIQLDLGYREHWYSPFKHSAQLISTNAQLGPSISLSTILPIENWWNISFDLFYTRLDKVENGISFQREWYDGSPHLIGTHLSFEPIDGWKVGFNRLMQFGGGPREVSVGDIVNAFFDPATNDNAYNQDERDAELGDQLASITTSYKFDTNLPIEIYAEIAGEDTQGGSNLSLGNQATNFGIFLPQLYNDFAVRYEYNRWKTLWYTNHLYANGNTNKGRVFGHYAGDQRTFGHGVPAEVHKATIDYHESLSASWSASVATLSNSDKAQYDKAYEFQLENRRVWQGKHLDSKLTVGKSVFSEKYGQLSVTVSW